MHRQEDMFSPELVDEQLDLSLQQRELDAESRLPGEADPDLVLISDLRYLYGAEGTENVRSLQRVWEHLQQQPGRVLSEEKRPSHLRLVPPVETSRRRVARRFGGVYGRGLAGLAAVLFLVIMVGSLLVLVHLTRAQQNSVSARSTATTQPAATPQPTLIPGYPYALPGGSLAVSPTSPAPFTALAWSPDSKRLALSTQGQIWLWDVASQQYSKLLNASLAGGNVKALAWSPDGRYLAVGTNPIEIVDVVSGTVTSNLSADYPLAPVAGQTTLVTALGWSPEPNGTLLAVATQHTDGSSLVFIWNKAQQVGVSTFQQQNAASAITALSWSGDDRYIASTDGQKVQAWDIHTTSVIFTHAVDATTTVAWSPAGGLLAFVDQRQTQVWDVWHHQRTSRYPAASGLISWDRTGKYLATVDGQTVILLDAASNTPIYTFNAGARSLSFLAWSPDGNSIATIESASPGANTVHIWSA